MVDSEAVRVVVFARKNERYMYQYYATSFDRLSRALFRHAFNPDLSMTVEDAIAVRASQKISSKG